MKVLRLLLTTVLAASGLVLVAPAQPVWACSCAMGTPANYLDWSDVVFVGTLTDPPVDEAEGPVLGSDDPLVYAFDVDRVFEGAIGPTADVRSARFGASCGLEGLEVGERYLMFAETGRRPDVLTASLCGGSQVASSKLVRKVEALTGSGESPAARLDGGTAPSGNDVSERPVSNSTGGYLLIGFAAVVLAGVAWVLLPRRRRKVGGPA